MGTVMCGYPEDGGYELKVITGTLVSTSVYGAFIRLESRSGGVEDAKAEVEGGEPEAVVAACEALISGLAPITDMRVYNSFGSTKFDAGWDDLRDRLRSR